MSPKQRPQVDVSCSHGNVEHGRATVTLVEVRAADDVLAVDSGHGRGTGEVNRRCTEAQRQRPAERWAGKA